MKDAILRAFVTLIIPQQRISCTPRPEKRAKTRTEGQKHKPRPGKWAKSRTGGSRRLFKGSLEVFPGVLEPGSEDLFAGGDEEGVLYGDAAELADLGKGEVPAHCHGQIVAYEGGVGLVGGIVRAYYDWNSFFPVLLGGVLEKSRQ